MPIISRFYGIAILIYARDHHPPHFHVSYNEHKAVVAIKDLKIIEGALPSRVRYLVIEWALLHRKELYENWELASEGRPVNKIRPLE